MKILYTEVSDHKYYIYPYIRVYSYSEKDEFGSVDLSERKGIEYFIGCSTYFMEDFHRYFL